jgi:hypothetical protein
MDEVTKTICSFQSTMHPEGVGFPFIEIVNSLFGNEQLLP